MAQTLTVTDVFTGWTEIDVVRNKVRNWVLAVLVDLRSAFPFAVLGSDSGGGSEFVNAHLLRYCEQEQITFIRSRAGRKNDGAYVEQKNWSVVRHEVRYDRYDTPTEVALRASCTRD